jgi:hypothetical protein
MKRVLSAVFLFSLLASGHSQGTVKFFNDSTTRILYGRLTCGGPPSLLPSVPNQFYFALFTAPVGTTDPEAFTFSGHIGANQAVAGRFSGGVVSIFNYPAGAHLAMLVRAWSANAGTNWQQFQAFRQSPFENYYSGRSGIASDVILGGGPIPAGTIFSTISPEATPGFTLWDASLSHGEWRSFLEEPADQTVSSLGAASFRVSVDACPSAFYQWYFNGLPIASATNGVYEILHPTKAQAGAYHVVAFNWYWGWTEAYHTSRVATLTVIEAPRLKAPIPSRTAVAGSTVQFKAHVTGDEPMGYQWFINTKAISSGGNTPNLQLRNVGLADAGTYSLVVTNLGGAVTSPPAALAVVPPVSATWTPAIRLHCTSSIPASIEAISEPGAADWATIAPGITQEWFFDTAQPQPSQRFYRAYQPASDPGSPPWLELHSVPSLRLTGAISDRIRIDYINQLGPIDAWVNLATVELTNTVQDYYDLSSIGQPPRVYRTGLAQ